LLCLASPAGAPSVAEQEPAAASTTPDALEPHRARVEALNEHFLGSAARAVRFDWRRSPAILGVAASEVIERNTFGQLRFGGVARKAFGDLLGEVSVHYAHAIATPSSDTLALTPFRQAGRPPHLELEVDVGYAIAEGVVTPITSWIPPAEMALVAWAGARYLVYPEGWIGRPITDVGLEIVSPQLSEAEILKIEGNALDGMLVDPARLHTLVGLSLDVYFQPGVVLSPRAMVAVPVLAPVTATQLGFFWELGLTVGYAL
jgi:hypothetical protein